MKHKSIFHGSRTENERLLSELHGLLISGKLPLREYVSSLFCGRQVISVWFQNPRVWAFEFELGPPVFVEPIMVNLAGNRLCKAMMAGGAIGMSRPNTMIK